MFIPINKTPQWSNFMLFLTAMLLGLGHICGAWAQQRTQPTNKRLDDKGLCQEVKLFIRETQKLQAVNQGSKQVAVVVSDASGQPRIYNWKRGTVQADYAYQALRQMGYTLTWHPHYNSESTGFFLLSIDGLAGDASHFLGFFTYNSATNKWEMPRKDNHYYGLGDYPTYHGSVLGIVKVPSSGGMNAPSPLPSCS